VAEAAAAGSLRHGLYNVRHAFIQSKGHYWGQLNVCTHICMTFEVVPPKKMLRFLKDAQVAV
jgi:hypothetical protein